MIWATENWFDENKGLENYEVADFLEEIIQNEFNVSINDGSLLEVGTYITEYFKICTNPSYKEETVLNFLRSLPKCDLSKSKIQDEDETVEDNLMETDESLSDLNNLQISEPHIDEDGFEMVKARKKK